MKNILVVNEGLSDNLGDQAITSALKQLILDSHFHYFFSDFTRSHKVDIHTNNAPKETRNKAQNKSKILTYAKWLVRNIPRLIRTLRSNNIDTVVIGGGQLILSNAYFPIALFSWSVLAYLFNKRVIIFSVGIGERFNYFEHSLILVSLSIADEVIVRDQDSRIKIKQHLTTTKLDIIPDVAYYLHSHHKNIETRNIYEQIVGVVDYEVYLRYNSELSNTAPLSEEEYFESWIKKISNLEPSKFCLFYTTESDKVQSKAFQNYILKKYHISVDLVDSSSLPELIGIIAKSKKVISGRMHALILAQTLDKEIQPYIISKKIESFRLEYGMTTTEVKALAIQNKFNKLMNRDLSSD